MRRQRFLVGVLTVALVASACSSSSSDDDATTTTEAAVTTTTADTVEDTTTTTTAEVVDDEPARVVEAPDPDPTPIELDPAVRTGVLDNGLTYYAMSNDSPGGKLELRLVVDAGSLHQDVPDAGSAHFLEHMLFNGTEQFPGLALDDVLRGFGMQIGPDLNAYTWFDETVYILSLPANDETVETGFDVLREWMTNATLDEDAVVGERGVVREEQRVRDETAGGVINQVIFEAYVADSPYVGREVIGSTEQILGTTSEGLRTFYDQWYRPEHMAVVAVGDLPVDELVQLITDEFSDVEPRSDELLPQPDRTAPLLDEIVIDVVTHPDGPEPRVSLDYALPHWDPSTVGGERLRTIENVANRVLSVMLDTAAQRGTIDVLSPGGSAFGFTRERRFFGFNYGGDDLAAATEDVIGLISVAARDGVDPTAFDRVVASLAAGAEQELAGLGSRQDDDIADSLVQLHLEGVPFDDLVERTERQLALLDELTVQDIDDYLAWVMPQSAPIAVAYGNDPSDITLADLEAAVLAGLEAESVDTGAGSDVTPGQELMAAPERIPAVSVEDVDVEAVDATEVVLANGIRVFIAESQIAEGSVVLLTTADGGFSVLEPGQGIPLQIAAGAASRSGVGDFDRVDLGTILSDRNVSLDPFVTLLQEGFQGGANSDDVETLFQLLHLGIVAPRVDEAAWREALDDVDAAATFYETDPGGSAFVELIDARHGDTGYHDLAPDPEVIGALSADDALALVEQRLGAVDDMTVVVVGDISTEVIIELAERYLSDLPTRPADTWIDRTDPAPDGVVTRTVSAGEEGAGGGFDVLITSAGDVSDRERAAMAILQSVINARFFESIREELGASYNGGSAFISEADPDEPGIEMFISVDADPDRLDEVHQRMIEELTTIATNGITDDDFDEAIAIAANDLNFISNGDLLTELLEIAEDGDDAWTLLAQFIELDRLRRTDVDALAARLLDLDQRIEVFRSNG